MNKKITAFVILIMIFICLGIFVYEKSKKESRNNDQFIKGSDVNVEANKYAFNFEGTKYEFKYEKDWNVEKKTTGQFKTEDIFKLKDSSNNELISLTILPESAEGPTEQSMDPKNQIDIKINNISGTNFSSSDGKNIYMLNDGKFVYLWVNNMADNLIFDEIVQSFKKL